MTTRLVWSVQRTWKTDPTLFLGMGQNSPSASFQTLPDQPDRATVRAYQNELIWLHQMVQSKPEVPHVISMSKSDKPYPTNSPTDRSLPIALLRAREKVMGPIRVMLLKAGVTEQQWRVLRVLDEAGQTDASEIAKRSCLLMPSLTRIIQTLCENGYVTRTRDTNDRRRQILDITKAGQSGTETNIFKNFFIFTCSNIS